MSIYGIPYPWYPPLQSNKVVGPSYKVRQSLPSPQSLSSLPVGIIVGILPQVQYAKRYPIFVRPLGDIFE